MFRITPQMMTRTALFHNQFQVSRLANLQSQASSGLRYSRPSDSPRDTNAIGVLNRSLTILQTQQERIQDVKAPLNNSVSQLIESNNLITRAKQIALQAPQSTGQPDRTALVAEIDSIIDRFVSLANFSNSERYLYSGNATETEPFHVENGDGFAIPNVEYRGSSQNVQTFISESISITSTWSGNNIFGSSTRGETLFFGNTGAKPGSGTDSLTGRANLVVSHGVTSFDGASGVASGTSGAESDTIIGPLGKHSLTIIDTSGDGSSGTVSLNGGSEIPWSSSDTDLQLRGPQGELVHVNTSSISAGFNGKVEIQASGNLSTDGGRTESLIDFSSNQVIINSDSGDVLNVNSTDIRFSGTQSAEATETADAITALLELKDDLLNTRNLDDSELYAAFDRRVGDLERVGNQILDVVGEQSVALQNLEQLSSQNQQNQLDLKTRLGELESADLASVVVEMQSLQTAIQFNYAALSIVQSNNLLDFLG